MSSQATKRAGPNTYADIDIQLREVQQLFNSLDPTPFPDRDLDADAEEFIIGWAMEHPSHLPLRLRVYLRQPPPEHLEVAELQEAVRHYFDYRAQVIGRQLRQLLANGRVSLAVGLVCMSLTVGVAHLVGGLGDSAWVSILRESIIIGGWVAMWRPIQIFLYDWWPIRKHRSLCLRLARVEVQFFSETGDAIHRGRSSR